MLVRGAEHARLRADDHVPHAHHVQLWRVRQPAKDLPIEVDVSKSFLKCLIGAGGDPVALFMQSTCACLFTTQSLGGCK